MSGMRRGWLIRGQILLVKLGMCTDRENVIIRIKKMKSEYENVYDGRQGGKSKRVRKDLERD